VTTTEVACLVPRESRTGLRYVAERTGVAFVQNVNARGTIYSMWIILRKCEGGCEARLVRSREQIW